jgi:hypothetical protein
LIDAQSAPRYFNGGPQNVGVQLGANSHRLTDVDLDCAEAITIAPYLLPKTKAKFGRQSARASHWLYYTDLCTTCDGAAIQFTTVEGNKLVELRIGGGDKGAQTVFPGSVHKDTGEPILWEEDGEPADIDGLDLLTRIKCIAAFCLIARAWPPLGGRHDAARMLGGLLARAGWDEYRIKLAAETIARAAGDEEWKDRVTAAKDQAQEFHDGGHAYGYPKLVEIVGKKTAKRVADWLDYDARSDPTDPPPGAAANTVIHSLCAATVTMKAVTWLWPNRFAIGKLGLLVGLPDEGKGQVLADIAARVTCAAEWPCGEGIAPLGNIIMLTAEDDPADTVVPRLAAAGADLKRIHFVNMVSDAGKNRMFSLVTDLQRLRQKIAEIGGVVLILIDPISAYLGHGKVDSFRTTDVRAVLGPVVDLAGVCKLAIIAIMHFNKKVDITNALLRISDSLAFGATARHVYGVVGDAENKRKLVVRAKNNLASADMADKALAYRFGLRQVGRDPETGQEIWAPHVIWESQYVDVTATEAMQAATSNKAPAARDEAKKFLKDELANGPKAVKKIEDAAEGNGISWRTVERAKRDLHVTARKGALDEGWTWELPTAARPRWND